MPEDICMNVSSWVKLETSCSISGAARCWVERISKSLISSTICTLRDAWGSFRAGEAEALSDSDAAKPKQGSFNLQFNPVSVDRIIVPALP